MASTPKETTTKTEPWDGAKPYILKYLDQADQLYDAGAPQYYQGSTVADQSSATRDALNTQEQIARSGAATQGIRTAQNSVNNIASGNAFSNQPNQTLSQLQGGINLGTNPAAGQIGNAPGSNAINAAMSFNNPGVNATQQAMAGISTNYSNPALANLTNIASGSQIGNNPYLDKMVSNQQDAIAEKLKTTTLPGLSSQAAMLGRSGSNAFATQVNNANTTAANEMAKVATDMYSNQYNTDTQNMLNANNTMGTLSNAQQGLRNDASSLALQGAGQLGQQALAENDARLNAANAANSQYQFDQGLRNDIYQQGVQNQFSNADLRMNAANSQAGNQNAQANTQLGAAGMAGDMYDLNYAASDRLAGIGAARDTRSQDVLNADIARWDAQQNQPLQNISNMINMANGGGYNNVTSPVYNNTAGQVMGGIGSLVSLLALCDVTTKNIIRQVGFMPVADGSTIPMYEFTYKNDPDQKTWIGPIAQEVEAILPDAVVEVRGVKHIITDTFMEAA